MGPLFPNSPGLRADLMSYTLAALTIIEAADIVIKLTTKLKCTIDLSLVISIVSLILAALSWWGQSR
jgi:hypothetical protein